MSIDKNNAENIINRVLKKNNANNNQNKKTLFTLSNEINEELSKSYIQNPELGGKSLSELIGSSSHKKVNRTTVPRIAFTEDPVQKDNYFGLFKNKKRLLPDWTIKRIRQEDHLVASILRARGNTMSMFARLRKDRFDIGIEGKIKSEYDEIISPEQRIKIQERISRSLNILMNCGSNDGVSSEEKMLLSDFLYIQTYNGLSFGRFATEVIFEEDELGIDLDQ
jgi:hypothetical protein